MEAGLTCKIKLEPGVTSIAIGDRDISSLVESVEVHGERYSFPYVALSLRPEHVEIEGIASVVVESLGTAGAFLASIDAKQLEAEALQRSPYSGSVTVAMLEILKERASGPSPS